MNGSTRVIRSIWRTSPSTCRTNPSYCDTCWVTFSKSNQSLGCVHHAGQPRLWRRGNPVLSQVMVDTKQWMRRETQGYKSEGNFALLPDQVLENRRQLVSTGSLRDYSNWVPILLGVHVFLRADAIVGIMMTANDDAAQHGGRRHAIDAPFDTRPSNRCTRLQNRVDRAPHAPTSDSNCPRLPGPFHPAWQLTGCRSNSHGRAGGIFVHREQRRGCIYGSVP